MATLPVLTISNPGYGIKLLSPSDTNQLQTLFTQCTDFFVMTNGMAAEATTAAEEFKDVPDGKTSEDVCVFGLVDDRDQLVGTIIGVQSYPNAQTWWLGLMLLAPEQRGKGLGANFFQAFRKWVEDQDYRFISLCAIAPNTVGRQFWRRMGFEEIRQVPSRTYGKLTHDVYVYRLSL